MKGIIQMLFIKIEDLHVCPVIREREIRSGVINIVTSY